MTRTTKTLHELIVNNEDARACNEIPDASCREVPGNFFKMLSAQSLTQLGDALLNPKVILPWLLQALGAPLFLIGFLVPIRESGSMLPQLVIASYVRSFERRKYAWILGSILQGLFVFCMALSAAFSSGLLAGGLIILWLIGFSLARGLCSIATKDVTGKVIPKPQRGRLNGIASSVSGLVTLVSAGLLFLFGQVNSLDSVIVLLGVAGLSWFIASAIFWQVEEYAGEVSGGKNGWQAAMANLSIIARDAAFRRFVLARSFLLCSALAAPYLVLLANQDEVDISQLVFFMAASGAAGFLSGPFWGRFADLSSRQTMVWAGAGASAICLLVIALAVALPSALAFPATLPLLYVLLTISHQGVRVGRKTYLTNMAEGDQRTTYVSVCNTLIGIVLLGVGGLTALLSSLGAVVVLFTLMCLGMLGVVMSLALPEVE
ncbi:MFS transporter [Salinibius halmophilus]|uniref:MFS transporter n=1 Tax=Salinibius halmophilus TaxID=1853216 RepID=UPI000E662EE9|nr:MFS transporter [Salinibius halmophilus]